MPRRKRQSMTSLLCNSYNGCAPSSSQKLKFSGALLFVIVIYSKQTTSESGGFAEGNQEGAVDFSLRVDKDATEEEDESAGGEDEGGYELKIDTHID